MKFMHVMIRVKDIDASLKFYTELLNLNKTAEVKFENSTLYYLSDEDGQTQIELTHEKNPPVNGYNNGNAFGHFAFETDDMNVFTRKLHAMGYDYTVAPYYILEIEMQAAFIKDPDGNEIEIMSK